MSLRADNEHALALLDRRHSFHAIDGKIHDHLLHLDSIPTDRRKARRELEPYRHSMPERLVLHQRNRLLDDPVDVELRHLRVGLLREVANPADHLAGEYRWFLVRRVPLRNENGEVISWYGVGH